MAGHLQRTDADSTTSMPPSETGATENLQGSFFMVLAMAGFTINDLIVKSLGATLDLGQTLFMRGCFATFGVFLLAIYLKQFRDFHLLLNRAILFRSAAEAVATLCFVYAVFNIPIANVSAIFQALPLALTLAAAVVLKEKIGARRLSAIVIGFIGVLIIVRPGLEGFSVYSVLVLIAVAASVVRDITTRGIPRKIPGMMITLSTAIIVTLTGLVLSLFQPWQPVTGRELSLLAGTSVFLIVGYFFVVTAMRTGEVGFVTPFRYSVLLFSILGGYLFFDERPDGYTLLGAAIIVASGIYMLYRERIVRRQAITPPPQRI